MGDESRQLTANFGFTFLEWAVRAKCMNTTRLTARLTGRPSSQHWATYTRMQVRDPSVLPVSDAFDPPKPSNARLFTRGTGALGHYAHDLGILVVARFDGLDSCQFRSFLF
jgi:hypothetical protein